MYLGSVEKITRPNNVTQIKRHIGGVVIETIGSADGGCAASDQNAVRYVLRDHLGGVDVLTDAMGNIDQEMSFDAWGRRRNAATWRALTDAATVNFDHCATTRGFTDHEMLDEVGLVHMNGRIYDPTLARFLQADPFVQFPGNLQNHNRYSYVLNNPLAYTDPSGHFIFTLSALAYVAAQQTITWYTAVAVFGAASFGDALLQGASFEQALRSGFLSGISAAAFSGIGNVLGTHFGGGFAAGLSRSGFALKVALHGTVGGITNVLRGGKFGHGFASAGFTALGTSFNNSQHIGRLGFSPLRVVIGAAIGGTASRITGAKFANGAITGAFSQALNQESNEIEFKDRLYKAYETALAASVEAEGRIRSAIEGASEGESVPLTLADLNAIRLPELLLLQISNPYADLNLAQFYDRMRWADGWLVETGFGAVQFELRGEGGQSLGQFAGSDINYYYLGFAVASTDRRLWIMTRAIEVWNRRQIRFEGAEPEHNLRQIEVGNDWMHDGHRFYLENRIKR